MVVLDGYGAIVVDGLGSTKEEEEEEDGKMGEGEFGSVGRSLQKRVGEGGRRRRGGEPGTVTQFNPRLLAMKSDEKQNRRMRQNERTERPREERPRRDGR